MQDNTKTLICPACKGEMVKIFVPEEGINLDVCLNGCGGIYFGNREFRKIDKSDVDINKFLDNTKKYKEVDKDEIRICPSCGAKMVKNSVGVESTVQIDECYACGGKFLDNGELQKIKAEQETNDECLKKVLNTIYVKIDREITGT